MSLQTTKRKGGLVLGTPAPIDQGPLQDGADISWIPRCNVGENQGEEGACSMFAIANWVEIMFRKNFSSEDILTVYRKNAVMGGLSIPAAFTAAQYAGWLPGKTSCMSVENLDLLYAQPIIAGYEVTDAFLNASNAGCLDHDPALVESYGYHAVVIVAKQDGQQVLIENSWGSNWGYKGLGQMTYALHLKLCRGLWVIT